MRTGVSVERAARAAKGGEAVKKGISLLIVLFVAAVTGCSDAGTLDVSLRKAKAEGKIVMPELGSVGCIPCEQMKPVMERLRTDYRGRLEVIFVDVRRDPANARKYGATMIPTQVLLDRNGKEIHRHIGFYGYDEIVPLLKNAGI